MLPELVVVWGHQGLRIWPPLEGTRSCIGERGMLTNLLIYNTARNALRTSGLKVETCLKTLHPVRTEVWKVDFHTPIKYRC